MYFSLIFLNACKQDCSNCAPCKAAQKDQDANSAEAEGPVPSIRSLFCSIRRPEQMILMKLQAFQNVSRSG